MHWHNTSEYFQKLSMRSVEAKRGSSAEMAMKLSQALGANPLGRKNWLFCWTEVGAHAVAIVQTLIACCKLHGGRIAGISANAEITSLSNTL